MCAHNPKRYDIETLKFRRTKHRLLRLAEVTL